MSRVTRKVRQGGSEVIEFALILPFILLLFFGIVELALGFHDQAILVEASRAAAREGVRYFPKDPSEVCLQTNLKTKMEELVQTNIDRMFTWKGAEYAVKVDKDVVMKITTEDDKPITDLCLRIAGDTIKVTLTYRYQPHILPNFMNGALGELNIVATTTMRSQRS